MEESFDSKSESSLRPLEGDPQCTSLFWVSVVTGGIGIASLATSVGTEDFYYLKTNTSDISTPDNVRCTETLVSLWTQCARPCDHNTSYTCTGISPNDEEVFITVSRVLASLGLASAVIALVLSVSSHVIKKMNMLIAAILLFILAGLLNIVGGYLFVLKFRSHLPGQSTLDKHTTILFLEQGLRWSFHLCVISFASCLMTAFLNGTEWCRAINFGLD